MLLEVHRCSVSVIWLILNVLLLLPSPSAGIKGIFTSYDFLTNKRLPYVLKTLPSITNAQCRKYCELHPMCDSFAMSTFERSCNLYALVLNGNNPIVDNGFKLFVKQKSEDDGYYLYGSNYIKLFLTLRTAWDANSTCAEAGGMLVSITDAGLNNLILTMMDDHKIFNAWIGITDQAQELNWLNFDGTTPAWQNWAYNGMWYRRDKNCAIIKPTDNMYPRSNWYQRHCGDLQYFVCQIPVL